MRPRTIVIVAFVILVIIALLLINNTKNLGSGVTGNIISIVTPDYMGLKWQVPQNTLSQKIGIATECTADTVAGELKTTCNWEWTDLPKDSDNYRDYDLDTRLKFYQLVDRVKTSQGSCAPECQSSCGTLNVFGWVDSCTGGCIKTASCEIKQETFCCFIESDSQGWYDADCETVSREGLSRHLIKYDGSCQVQAQICDQTSDIFVKFSQPLYYSAEKGKTSINWLIATQDVDITGEYPFSSSTEFLKTEAVDYVTLWNPAKQEYYGASFGISPSGEKIVTGPFSMTQYTPYFVGAKRPSMCSGGRCQVTTKVTWAGTLPPRITFPLKHVTEYLGKPTFSYNYIVLPFDTKIKLASQLCDPAVSGIPIDQNQGINMWDSENQKEIIGPGGNLGGAKCSQIRIQNSPYDFNLEPGRVYKIIVTQDAYWRQK